MISTELLKPISDNCSRFIVESRGIPLLKNLPAHYEDVQRVKVRHKKLNCTTTEIFNAAFAHNLRQRAVFANGPSSFKPILDETVEDHDIFYVFPTDSFRFIYNPAVEDSNGIFTEADDIELGVEVLRFGYTSLDLYEGIVHGAEIVLYNIPRYYCVRSSTISYENLLTTLQKPL